jgi:flagellar L-ring protein precursor FlgH
MSARRRRAALAAAVLAAGVAVGPAASAQSLFRDGAAGAHLFSDHRARAVNDIVTIVITEQSSSARSANTEVNKESSRSAGVTRFPTIFDPVARRLVRPLTGPVVGFESPSRALRDRLRLEMEGSASHEGGGTIERSDRVTGRITARVVKVLDNGNLLIEGRRAVLVNGETQVITLSGVIRPQDVTATNTVASDQISDAEIQMTGRGILADAQRPGLLYRLLDWLRLF